VSIVALVKTIQDIMRKDVGVDGDAQRISQMVWLLFLKIFDDKEQEWQLTVKGYKPPLQSRFRWSNWAKDPEGITGEELIDFINNNLFPALKKLATTAGVSPHGKVIGSVFEDAYNYMKSGTLLRQVINTIESDVDFNKTKDRHLFNDIYEKISGGEGIPIGRRVLSSTPMMTLPPAVLAKAFRVLSNPLGDER